MPHQIREENENQCAIYSLYENREESIVLCKTMSNFLEIYTNNPFDRIKKWMEIPEDLVIQFKEALGVDELIMRPAVEGWSDNYMVFIVSEKYNYEHPFKFYDVIIDTGTFTTRDIEYISVNPEQGCIYNGEFVPKKYMKYLNC